MKTRISSFLLVATLAVMLAGPVVAQDTTASAKTDAVQPDPMQAVMEQFMVPGPEHKRLDEFVGEWAVKSVMWMEPGAEPMETVGEAVNRLILGGRYLYSEYTSSFMGQPFNGVGITGYDRYKKAYVSIWVDNFSTGIYASEGAYAPDASPAEDFGILDDFMTGARLKMRHVTTFIDTDTHRFEMYMTGPDGKEFKQMEMVYTRKK